MKRWPSILLGIFVSIVILYIILRPIKWDTLGDVLAHGRYIYVLPALLFCFLGLAFRAFRWRSLLNRRITLEHSFHILNASYLFYNLLPFRLGEIVRLYLPTRLNPPVSVFTNLSSVLVERFVDVLTVVICTILAIIMAPVRPEVEAGARISGLIAVVGIVVLVIFAVRRNWAHQFLALALRVFPMLKRFNPEALLDKVLDGISSLGSVRGASAAVGWTAISWLASLLISYTMLFVFFDQPKWNAVLLATSVASLAVAIPAAPGNVGPFEGAVIFGLTASGFVSAGDPQQQTQALAYAVMLHLVATVVYLVLGILGLSQEHISLGELFRSARQMTTRSTNEPVSATSEG
jgi:uncharacterized protein (TIRG00374 family)